MARNPTAPLDTADLASTDVANETEVAAKVKRDLGPKVVYIQLKDGVSKDSILSVHTNTRTLVDSMEQNPGSSYVKHTLPQGEPRGPKSKA